MSVLYIDNENMQTKDTIKNGFLQVLKNAYPSSIAVPTFNDNALELQKIAEFIKNTRDPIFIWNNLKPYCVWAIDICNRFNKDYIIVERGIVPSQGSDNYSFYAGGICFDNINIAPEFFDSNTFDSNLDIIENHYNKNKLVKKDEKDKIVIIGQLLFDSTVTHYSYINNYEVLINQIIDHYKININETEVVFCNHPRNIIKEKFKYKISQRPSIIECLDAKMVYAISSTIIYELIGLGINVTILGQSKKLFPTERSWEKILHCHSTALDYHFNTKTPAKEIHNKVSQILSIIRKTK